MSTPTYIAHNPDELFEQASTEVQDLIGSGEIESAVTTLSATYAIPEEHQTALSNIISFILIGAIRPEDTVKALEDLVKIPSDDAMKLASSLDALILKKVHSEVPPLSDSGVTILEFQGVTNKEELRKEILNTTKRESALTKPQVSTKPKALPKVITPGSRSQLLEQLQVLGSIPDDNEIETRLAHIQEQIATLKKQEEDNSLDSQIALKSFMFGEKGKTVADSSVIKTTYSVPPTKYTVDPYREVDPVS